ncbi:MAG TPA: DinB family protein [Terriglobales bacterium]|nr:DinB family protein [Terriglobales bacterium]
MPADLSLNNLLDYTEWERAKWHEWFRQHGDTALSVSTGPHADGRLQTVGEVVRHIFSAEKRYIDRLSGQAITNTSSVPTNDVEALFQFGQVSRTSLNNFIATLPMEDWNVMQEFPLMNSMLRATHQKVVVHILMHEIRHWAQIATMLRFSGLPLGEFHDFLFSPVFGGELRREPGQSIKV